MSSQALVGKRAAVLVSNGFCEREFKQVNAIFKKLGIVVRIISVDTNMIRGWNKEKISSQSYWGDEYAPSGVLQDTLACDYDILVLPAGERSIQKLEHEPSLKSFLSSFIKSGKPVVAYNYAVELLAYTGLLDGYSVAASSNMCDVVRDAGGRCVAPEFVVSKNLISLSRYRDLGDKLERAIVSILSGERYIDKVVSHGDVPSAYKAA